MNVDAGSFSLGVDIKDGSHPTDIAVRRVEGAAPYVDNPVGDIFLREIPLKAIIKNTEYYEAPPVDITIEVGNVSQVQWIPTLLAKEEFEVPFSAAVFVDADGKVLLGATVKIFADKADREDPEYTIVDNNRENNILEITIDDDFFKPDLEVEIREIGVNSLYHLSENTLIVDDIVSSDLTIPVVVKNIGTESDDRLARHTLRVFVNGELYDTTLVQGGLDNGVLSDTALVEGALDIAEERRIVFELHVPEGPVAMYCTYQVEVELESDDVNQRNNDDARSVRVESGTCVNSGPNQDDINHLDNVASGDPLDHHNKFDALNTVEAGSENTNPGIDSGTSNAPDFDRIDPPGL